MLGVREGELGAAGAAVATRAWLGWSGVICGGRQHKSILVYLGWCCEGGEGVDSEAE